MQPSDTVTNKLQGPRPRSNAALGGPKPATMQRGANNRTGVQTMTIDVEAATSEALRQLKSFEPRYWQEIDEERYDWLMNCVPPLRYFGNAFLNSEAYTSTEDGRTSIFMCCSVINGRFYYRLCTVAEFQTLPLLNPDEPLPPIKVFSY